jgi:hypothetical protein
MLAKIGTKRAAEAVLLVNSVRKMINAATAKITISGCANTKAVASCWPSAKEAPDFCSRVLRAMPPPKSSNTPQSVLRAISFQRVTPNTTTATAAASATTVSGLVMPKTVLILSPKIHATTAHRKISMANTRCSVHGMCSSFTSTRSLKLGRKIM